MNDHNPHHSFNHPSLLTVDYAILFFPKSAWKFLNNLHNITLDPWELGTWDRFDF